MIKTYYQGWLILQWINWVKGAQRNCNLMAEWIIKDESINCWVCIEHICFNIIVINEMLHWFCGSECKQIQLEPILVRGERYKDWCNGSIDLQNCGSKNENMEILMAIEYNGRTGFEVNEDPIWWNAEVCVHSVGWKVC